MKNILLLLFVFFIMSCDSDQKYPIELKIVKTLYDCSEVTPKVVKYSLTCIKNAGMSGDSEPEDWLYKCEQMAERLYCTQKNYWVTQLKYTSRSQYVVTNKEEIK